MEMSTYPPRPTFLELFEQQASCRPDHLAVVDPEGGDRLSYAELARRARRVAAALHRYGVGPEVRVGVAFERVPEWVVAFLGVLAAGGVYVPIDPAWPEPRRRQVEEHGNLSLLLDRQRLRELERSVPDESEGADAAALTETFTAPDPRTAAYVIYTSGSTGEPKGVVVEHRSLAWYLATFGGRYAMAPGENVLQFSSPGFDLSIAELTLPLAYGAAVVLRGAETADSLDAFLEACRAWQIHVFLAPTAFWHELAAEIARRPGRLPPALRLVSFGGEQVLGERVRQWMAAAGRRIRLLNAYGPTETTIEAVVHEYADASTPASIGQAVDGMRAAVLDRRGCPSPPGSTGELALSGEGLARGYGGRPALTARCFVPDPEALEPGARRYLSGDIACLDDGELRILGRIDRQVKIRGVRVEPGEVEAHLAAHRAVGQVAVVPLEDQPGHRYLAAWVSPREAEESRPPAELAEDLRAFLRARLPAPLVPAAFHFLPSLPLDANAKIDRRALVERRDLAEHGGRDSHRRPYRAPRTNIERTLARIWAEVLRLEEVGIHDDVFELGGDSILNLKILARTGELGWRLSPRDLLRHPTIAELAEVVVAAGATPRAATAEDAAQTVRGPVPLTPIQHWFFEDLAPPSPWHFNQAVILEIRRRLDPRLLERAVCALLEHHDALRMRFEPYRGDSDLSWRQKNAGLEAAVAPLVTVDLNRCRRVPLPLVVRRVAQRLQASLDLEKGPLLRFAFFDRGPLPGRLFICVHHLVIDGVSWRILFDDLESLYTRIEEGEAHGVGALPRKTTSYKTWARLLKEHAGEPECRAELAHWRAVPRTAPPPPADFPAGDNVRQAHEKVTVELDPAATSHLLRRVPSAYRTRINDVLLSALLLAFARLTGRRSLLVELEGHGREDLFEGVDLSRTVGWFTTAFPVHLEAPENAGPGAVLAAVKETLRAIPRHGVGYYLLRYLSPDAEIRSALAAMRQPEVSFNYLGQMDPQFSPSSLFGPAGESTGERDSRRGRRPFVFEVDGFVADERLWINFKYSCQMYRRRTVEDLAAGFMEELRALVDHCLEPRAGGFTASDFPLAGLEAAQLQDLVGQDRDVEDLYPLSPTQEGLLFHALYTPGSAVYFEQNAWLIDGALDRLFFRRAFERLVERHAILRTGFAWRGLDRPLQIVRRHPALPWKELDWSALDADEQERKLQEHLAADRDRSFDLETAPLLRCCLIRLGRQRHRFVWSVHHLLLDGWSISLLLDELFALYDALRHGDAWERPRPRPFRDFIAWLGQRDSAHHERFWRRRLASFAEPTPLAMARPAPATGDGGDDGNGFELGHEVLHLSPRATSALVETARRRRSTPAVVAQGAWALILGRAADRREVVFGTTTAGRPQSLQGADAMIGLMVATLPVRVEIADEAALGPWLEKLHERHLDMLQHQWCSLPDIQRWSEIAPPRPLFESLFGFQNFPGGEAALRERHGELELGDLRYFSQTEKPLAVEVLPGERMELHARYDQRRFEPSLVARLLRSLATVLESLAAAPDERRLGDLSTSTAAEAHQVLYEWRFGARPETEPRLFLDLFAARVRRRPTAPALVWDAADGSQSQLGYGELAARAAHLATRLAARLTGPEPRVGVLAGPSPERVVGLLAAMLAGGVYVPLDPEHPEERHAIILATAGARVALVTAEFEDRLPAGIEPLHLGSSPGKAAPLSLRRVGEPESLAYAVYTSGSSGQPKGVLVEHRQLAALLAADTLLLGHHGEGCAVAQWAAPGFDVSILEICSALATGAALHVVPSAARLGASLAELIQRRGVTHLAITPSALGTLPASAAAELPVLSTMMVGGEPCPAELAARWTPLPGGGKRQWITAYGPTETTVCATLGGPPSRAPGSAGRHGGEPPLGRPFAGTEVLLLDSRLRPLPMGSVGELFLGGALLARGYAERPRETATRYLPHPTAVRPGERLYRSGDLARFSPTGELRFLGRADRQVKVRGQRIEPAEIERALESRPEVERAVVAPRDHGNGSRLVAWITRAPTTVSSGPIDGEEKIESEHVEHWRALYEAVYAHGFPNGRWNNDKASLAVGWISSYNEAPIPAAQMHEWLAHTLLRIRELKPRRVLEIGCGTGLLTMALAAEVEGYVGTDFSAAALRVLRSRLKHDADPAAADHVELRHQVAIDFTGIPDGAFDLVVLNSVTQYFPSLEYLRTVLRGAVRAAAPGGAVFLGDVRDLALHRAYCASVELHRATDELSAQELSARVEARQRREEELLIDPAFFHGLGLELPRLTSVVARPKRGRASNELTRFRYDVTLFLDRSSTPPTPLELDWRDDGLDLAVLQQKLEEAMAEGVEAVRVGRLPDARLSGDLELTRQLEAAVPTTTLGELRARLADSASAGLAPEDALEAARGLAWKAELAWSDDSPEERLQAIFHRRESADPAPSQAQRRPPAKRRLANRPLANRPLAERERRELVPRLRRALSQSLPEAMVPGAFVVLDEMPLNASGKIDRRSLPGVDDRRPELDSRFTAPRDPLEAALAETWAEVLGLDRVGVEDDFFELGGHSLLATRLVSRVRQRFAVEVPLRYVFEASTVARLAARMQDLRADNRLPVTAALRAAAASGALPLSFAQQRLWFLDRLRPGDPAFNMDDARWLEGRLDPAALAAALHEIRRRHQILRTTFPSRAGQPRQAIAPMPPRTEAPRGLPQVDLRGLDAPRRQVELRRLAKDEALRPFDLDRGPLMRARLVRFEGDDESGRSVLLRTVHHIVSDGWSESIFYRELGRLYEAFVRREPSPLPALPVQYADFTLWQRRWLDGPRLEEQLDYWRDRLAELPALELPAARRKGGTKTTPSRGAVLELRFGLDLSKRLRRLARRGSASLYMTLLAGFAALLGRLTGQNDLAVGSPIANRQRGETEDLIGFFVNTLVMRIHLTGRPSFADLLARVRETALGAYAHQDLPFERLVETLRPQRELDRHPLFQVVFALHPTPTTELESAGLRFSPLALAGERATVDLEAHLWEEGSEGRIVGYMVYRPGRTSPTFVARLAAQFRRLLDAAASAPGRPHDELEMLSAAERQQILVEWNEPRRRGPRPSAGEASTFHGLFFARAAERPTAPALRFFAEGRERQISYGELASRSRRLACLLRRHGVGPESRVGLLLHSSPEMIETLLAVLAAGGAFVPLDPDLPPKRLAYLIEDSGLELLLTHRSVHLPLPARLPKILEWRPDIAAGEEEGTLDHRCGRENLAYVIYTSGSTGRPKGAMLSHGGLVSLACDLTLESRPDDAVLQFASFSFDAAVFELVMAFSGGATLVLSGTRRPVGEDLVELLRRQRITQAVLPPSALTATDAEHAARVPRLRTLLVAGEACPPALARAWAPGRLFLNAYGPTETTICASSAVIDPAAATHGDERLPIGRPVQGFALWVLDRNLRPVPLGVSGELFLGGAGLGRGYLGRPALTATSFLPCPSHLPAGPSQTGARLYRTGDRVCHRADGQLDFLGRLDHQIKWRGYRIETGEIEALLTEHPSVRSAAVMAHSPGQPDEELADTTLVAWIEPRVESLVPAAADEHMSSWRALYEDLYASRVHAPDDFDVAGWRSSFTGRSIPADEMREWVEGTVSRLKALPLPPAPAVLEIGCGTGLLLWRLAPRGGDYLATDFAPAVIERLADRLAAAGEDFSRVKVRCQEAEDFRAIPRRRFDLVVLNSVAQYFPGIDYLLTVVRGAVEACAPGGVVFLGDLRHLGLHDAFCSSLELAKARDDLPLDELRRRIAERRASEEELLIDPALFDALPKLLPRIRGVRLEPRLGSFRNEMNLYRYDVTLKLDVPFADRKGAAQEDATPAVKWHDSAAFEDLAALESLVDQEDADALGLRRWPDPRLARDRRLLELLEEPGELATAGELREVLAEMPERSSALGPAELAGLARRKGRILSWRLEGFGRDGAHDVVFHPPQVSLEATEPEPEATPRPWSSYVNHPLRDRLARQLVPRLRRHLEDRLPAYMLPSRFVVLEEMPRNVAGKIDRRQLPDPGIDSARLDSPSRAPRTEIEKRLAAIWCEALGLSRVGVEDDFFELGGHSLLATRIMSRTRRDLEIELELGCLFEHPTVARLAAEIERRYGQMPEIAEMPPGESNDDSEIFEMLTL